LTARPSHRQYDVIACCVAADVPPVFAGHIIAAAVTTKRSIRAQDLTLLYTYLSRP
jgi:hypothetical protein